MALTKVTGDGLANSALPTGTILQTVVHQEDGMTSFTAGVAGTYLLLSAANAADSASHLSLSITPTSSSSKILLTTSVFFEGSSTDQQSYLWTIYRDSTQLGQPAASSRRVGIMGTVMGYYSSDAASTADSVSFNYYDTPNTTSAITYTLAFNHAAADVLVYLNRTVSDTDNIGYERGVSILIAQEIGA